MPLAHEVHALGPDSSGCSVRHDGSRRILSRLRGGVAWLALFLPQQNTFNDDNDDNVDVDNGEVIIQGHSIARHWAHSDLNLTLNLTPTDLEALFLEPTHSTHG